MNAYILIFIGIGLLLIGLIIIAKTNKLRKEGVEVDAIIHDFSSEPNNQGGRTYYPIVRFSKLDGVIVTEKHSFGFSFKLYRKGQNVKVFYNPDDHSKFIIVSNLQGIVCYVFIVIGLLLCIMGSIKAF